MTKVRALVTRTLIVEIKKRERKKKDILRKKILLRELKLDLTSCIFMFKRFYRSGFIPQ